MVGLPYKASGLNIFQTINEMAQDITYSYSYHLNVVSIKIDG